MRKLATALAIASMGISTVAAGPAAQDPPEGFQFELELNDGETASYEGSSSAGGTTAGSGFFGVGATTLEDCNTSPQNRCDKGLAFSKTGGTVDFELAASIDPADYDIFIYESDEDGTLGEEVASSGTLWGPVAGPLGVFAPIESGTFEAKRGGYYAIVVSYYAAGGGYTVTMTQS